MKDEWERLLQALDETQPNWEFQWASQSDLFDYTRGRPCGVDRDGLRRRVSYRSFHAIIHAALVAGIVTRPEQ